MKTNNTPHCEIELADLELKIEVQKNTSQAYYKIFHKGEEVDADYDILNITLDLKGIINLLNHIALCKNEEPYEKLSRYLVEYEDEKGSGDRTDYFRQAFKTNVLPKPLPQKQAGRKSRTQKHIKSQKK